MNNLLKSARLLAVSAVVYRAALVLAIGAALVSGEGSITIIWGAAQ